jgi:transcriptional regulator with XRE-family HTH domain
MQNVKLKDKLKVLDWSQAELARRIEVEGSTITRWINDKYPAPKCVYLYLDALIEIKNISDRLCK